MKNNLKYFEIIFFILVHILFLSPILAGFVVFGCIPALLGLSGHTLEYNEFVFFLIGLVIYVIYITLKIFLFPILYRKNKFPIIKKWFDSFYSYSKNQIPVFIFALLYPLLETMLFVLVYGENILWFDIFCGYGIFSSYLIMYFYLKRKNTQKV